MKCLKVLKDGREERKLMKNKNGSICEPHDLTEVFVGNTHSKNIPSHLERLATIRLGRQAFDINGEVLSRDEYQPMFLGRSELKLYEEIMKNK